jgi:hypothetical protein
MPRVQGLSYREDRLKRLSKFPRRGIVPAVRPPLHATGRQQERKMPDLRIIAIAALMLFLLKNCS